ncbi:MAG: hypothetical protein IJY47_05995 [Clostridia bacterium]|nr:hypothetical protein [Clostridia bacterium]
MKKIFALILCVFMLIPVFSSCSRPPEYAEIESRFRELVEASYQINQLFFGEGLPTYERVYDPRSTTDVFKDTETNTNYYYYEVTDPVKGRVIAFRSSYLDPFSYVQVLTKPDEDRELYYKHPTEKAYCYLLTDYTEPTYEFFYDEEDPADYDYVRYDQEIQSISQIKAMAEQVYSGEYLAGIYDSLFVGTVGAADSVSGLSARYMEYTDEEGSVSLMESNTFKPLITERRIYDFTTAEIVKPANKKFVTIEIDSYLESTPDRIQKVRLSMLLQDGQWMLDSATY